MLHEFLSAKREEVLAYCAEKILVTSDNASTVKLERGLPVFYDELIEVLRRAGGEAPVESEEKKVSALEVIDLGMAALHGEESLRLGYTISQVVHGYGGICQGITEYARIKGERITVEEFSYLNLCLDIGIAAAVTAYERVQREATDTDEVQRLGFLAHELRNALQGASLSFLLLKSGTVGIGGNTSRVLEQALSRMRDLIDRSLVEVRLRSSPAVERRKCFVHQLVSEVEVAALADARERSLRFSVEVPPNLVIVADHHFMVSALSNLVQNAIKFTKPGSTIQIRAGEVGERVVIEVEDRCGGLPTEKIEELFRPFTQMDSDRSGVGLGLAITRQAVTLNEGTLSARDVPGQGCVFSIDLPRVDELQM